MENLADDPRLADLSSTQLFELADRFQARARAHGPIFRLAVADEARGIRKLARTWALHEAQRH